MTEKETRCVKALRICHSNEDCRDCEFMESDRNEKSCVNVLFEDAADIIESLSERLESVQPKWISVDERLPVEDVTVLGAFLRYNGYEINITKYCVYPHRSVWFIGDMNAVGSTPTHWMPLPSAPKEEA